MEKVLGLDLGTNSIGWALIGRQEDNTCVLLDKGVHVFQDGVAHDKSGEKPAVQERTAARASRRHYFRRRLRKIELLKVLVENKMCPFLSEEQLSKWKEKKQYPLNEEFLKWQRTDVAKDDNPYHDRYLALTTKLDLDNIVDRYSLGRAFYHLNQRRGFLSNRKDSQEDADNGKVKSGISSLTKAIDNAGCRYLGEYFYHLYREGQKIRAHYTARNEHYRKEFDAICKTQELDEDLIKALERAIFYQRPLKSQKGNIGKCSFEKGKPRCPVSHPRYEEFRMLQFINSIRLKGPDDKDLRPLNEKEIEEIWPLFFRKSKSDFDFEEIAKKIAGKGSYGYYNESEHYPYLFNHKMVTNVSACPVSAAIINALGINPTRDWTEVLCSVYTKAGNKTEEDIINDVWHAIFSFDDNEHLKHWLSASLQIDGERAESLTKTKILQGYASLSLKAINKILPWLRKGYVYSDAVFLANLKGALPRSIVMNPDKMNEVEENVKILLEDFPNNPLNKESSKSKVIADYLYGVAADVHPEKLYHPSMINVYKDAIPDDNGSIKLGTPRVDAFKNPMAMRALFRLRVLLNMLLDENVINRDTKINIEFSRELNDSNTRKAIYDWQRERENLRKKDREEIRSVLGADYQPSEDDLLKYRLYEEQNHRCLYTGRQITPRMFLGQAQEFDIEHTVPRSRGGDNSMANKTLCDSKFNREIKGSRIPSELNNHETILQRIEEWKTKIDSLERQISFHRGKSKRASTKEEKDAAIRRIHYLKMDLDYWKGKYERFSMTAVPEGFSNRQGVDIGIIGRYARLYLKTVFNRIYIVKGSTTADFRKAWGLQEDYSKKERVNHSHHCIDAVTIACIGKGEYERWAHYMKMQEDYKFGKGRRPFFEKPWASFTEDVLSIPDSLIVSHYSPDRIPKESRKKARISGSIIKNNSGQPLYSQGDTARALLHKDTMYGAIKKGDSVQYVVRKAIESLEDKDIERIVDDAVKDKVKRAVQEYGSLKKAAAATIWMNEAKGVPINKVRVYVPTVTSPIPLKLHRDVSKMDYKRSVYVANDSNYCMAIYGEKSSFKLINVINAVKYYNGKNVPWIERSDNKGQPLRCILRPGKMVLFYEEGPEELKNCSAEELSARLYEIIGLSSMTIQNKYHYGTIALKHHQEARPSSALKGKNGPWTKDEQYRPIITIYHTQARFIVEGKDFTITTTGRITLNY